MPPELDREKLCHTCEMEKDTPERKRGITDDEKALLNHVSMWGAAGYPIWKCGPRHWYVHDFRSVKGCPSPFKTKREAVAQFEKFYDVLLDASAGRI